MSDAKNVRQSSILIHHGIKGQRWGIRRYQNEDGSYTSEGKKKYLEYKTSGIRNEQKKEKVEKKLSRNWDLNVARQNIENRTSGLEKSFYNDATRKRAAKFIVDKNMSYNDAVKKAKGEAIRNTVAILGTMGALSIGALAYQLSKNT